MELFTELYLVSIAFFMGFFYRTVYNERNYDVMPVVFTILLAVLWPVTFLVTAWLESKTEKDSDLPN